MINCFYNCNKDSLWRRWLFWWSVYLLCLAFNWSSLSFYFSLCHLILFSCATFSFIVIILIMPMWKFKSHKNQSSYICSHTFVTFDVGCYPGATNLAHGLLKFPVRIEQIKIKLMQGLRFSFVPSFLSLQCPLPHTVILWAWLISPSNGKNEFTFPLKSYARR